jgi:flagellar M-ring protein FliF
MPPPPVNTRKDAITNYEVDKTIQHVRKPVGGIRRLSVAVVVNHRKVTDEKGIASMQPLGEAEKAQIMDLVKEAMGFSRERGDTLNVVNSPFTETEKESVPELPLWQQPEMIELAKEIGKNVLIGTLILYLVLGVLRPMLKRMSQPPAQAPTLLTGNNEDSEMQPTPAPNQAPQLSQYDEKLALTRQLARDDPKMVATVVKKWVAGHD